MTPDEYRSAIAGLGLTQVKASAELGINERTSRRYASGKTKVPLRIALALSWLKVRPK